MLVFQQMSVKFTVTVGMDKDVSYPEPSTTSGGGEQLLILHQMYHPHNN